jgi:hypothetical protein
MIMMIEQSVQFGVKVVEDINDTCAPADDITKATGIRCFWITWPGVTTGKDAAVIIHVHGTL